MTERKEDKQNWLAKHVNFIDKINSGKFQDCFPVSFTGLNMGVSF